MKAGFIFELILIAVIILITVYNYKKGVFRSLKLVRIITSIILAWKLKTEQNVLYFIGRIFKLDNFEGYVNERITAMWGEKLTEATTSEEVDNILGIFGKFSSKLRNYTADLLAEKTENFAADVTQKAAFTLKNFVGQALAFILIFAVTFILLFIAVKILNKIFNKGALKPVNKILGGVFGLLFGFVAAWILALIIINFAPAVVRGELDAVLDGFGFLRWLYNSFPLSKLFGITPV